MSSAMVARLMSPANNQTLGYPPVFLRVLQNSCDEVWCKDLENKLGLQEDEREGANESLGQEWEPGAGGLRVEGEESERGRERERGREL
eukprot:756631-Hanusia_phi.AAC.5